MAAVFLSWSGDRSRRIAEAVGDWIAGALPDGPEPWISTQLGKGVKWSDEIGRRLADSVFGIVCLTPESLASPWMLFEAGALSNAIGDVRVCPLLFGISLREFDGPLVQFQAATYDKDDLLILLRTLNSLAPDGGLDEAELRAAHDRGWPQLVDRLKSIESDAVRPEPGTIDRVLTAFGRHGLPDPLVGGEVAFTAGFESHGLYSSVMETAQERLLVYGRKNRKLFDKEHGEFFRSLPERVSLGFDFRALFLDPRSPEHVLRAAHRDEDFPDQLSGCIHRARRLLEQVGLDPDVHCRTYRVNRTAGLIIADDAVAYSPVRLDENGNATGLTRASCSVTATRSEFGAGGLESF